MYHVALAFMVVMCFVTTFPASAMNDARPTGGGNTGGGGMNPCQGTDDILDHLEELGYDVSAIRTAVDSGDTDTARTLMKQFMEEHKDALPQPDGAPPGDRPYDSSRMTGLLNKLTEQGFDVSAIRAAVDSGDMDTARTLMKQFMEEHKDQLPERPEQGGQRAA
jgi:hypothetical protein